MIIIDKETVIRVYGDISIVSFLRQAYDEINTNNLSRCILDYNGWVYLYDENTKLISKTTKEAAHMAYMRHTSRGNY